MFYRDYLYKSKFTRYCMNSYVLTRENDWGNIEYKIAFIDMTLQKRKICHQLKFRVIEGRGNATFIC